jgi:hypothetical protein
MNFDGGRILNFSPTRHAILPQESEHLHRLHQRYSEERLTGCVVQSKDYWNQYLSHELKNSMHVLTVDKYDEADKPQSRIMSWLSI